MGNITSTLTEVDSVYFKLLDLVDQHQAKTLELVREKDADLLEKGMEVHAKSKKLVLAQSEDNLIRGTPIGQRLIHLLRLDDAIIAEALKGNGAIAQQRFVEEATMAVQATSKAITEARQATLKSLEKDRSTTEKQAMVYKWTAAGVAGLGLLAFIALGLRIGSGVVTSFRTTTTMLRDMAEGEGDLTKRLAVKSDDEIGEMSKCFNTFLEKIHKVVSTISSTSITLSAASEEMSVTAASLSKSVDQMNTKTSSVADSARTTSGNLTTISRGANTISDSVNSVASGIEEMSASIREVAQHCRKELEISTDANGKSQVACQSMDRLSHSAHEIGKVVGLIKRISDQTNLLALNASIQASAAGAAGRAFAVVAGEIKELATQTAQATGQIETKVSEMRSSSDAVVTTIQDVAKIIEEVHRTSDLIAGTVDEQSKTVADMAERLGNTNQEVSSMVSTLSESAKGITTVSTDVESISEVASETARQGSEIKTSSLDLSKMAAELDQIVHQFRV
jgi:methyl-accepting chemotaxis protein